MPRFEPNMLGMFGHSSGSEVYKAIMDETSSFDAGNKKYMHKPLGKIQRLFDKYANNMYCWVMCNVVQTDL
jgi:hypothetical protein